MESGTVWSEMGGTVWSVIASQEVEELKVEVRELKKLPKKPKIKPSNLEAPPKSMFMKRNKSIAKLNLALPPPRP